MRSALPAGLFLCANDSAPIEFHALTTGRPSYLAAHTLSAWPASIAAIPLSRCG
jgi:hypothetical protein